MSEQKPKKPRQKSKRLNLSTKAQWESILKSVEKKEIPITMLESIDVNLADGTRVKIGIRELLNEGADPDDLEKEIKAKLKNLDHYINDIDFFISVSAVQKIVQPATDELLKNL
jgi:signal transduction histidine kinase